MRTWDYKKGQRIIMTIYEHEPHGISFRKLAEKTQIWKSGLEKWLVRLKDQNIVKKITKTGIHLTEETIEKINQGGFSAPLDPNRKREKQIGRLTKLDKATIILILMKAVFDTNRYRKYRKQPKKAGKIITDESNPEQIIYFHGRSLRGVAINDILDKSVKSIGSPDKNALQPNRRINDGNGDLFGYRKITENEANEYFNKLLNHEPPILKQIPEKNQHRLTTRYIVFSELLCEFIKECIFTFNMNVSQRLQWMRIYEEIFINPEEKKEISEEKMEIIKERITKSLIKHINILYGSTVIHNYDIIHIQNQKKKLLELDEQTRKMMTDYIKEQILRMDHDSRKYLIFDPSLMKINKKYKILKKEYPEIVDAFLNILFPEYIRNIWRKSIYYYMI